MIQRNWALYAAGQFRRAALIEAVPGGWVTHLWHNKHELTFLWPMS